MESVLKDADGKDSQDYHYQNEGDCEIESARSSADSILDPTKGNKQVSAKLNNCTKEFPVQDIFSTNDPGSEKQSGREFKTASNLKKPSSSQTILEGKSGKYSLKRKGLYLLPWRRNKTQQSAMDRLLHEIALRTQHKATTLELETRKLGETVDSLRDENRALKRLQRSQRREINDRHDFVDMANISLKGFRKDVRFSEETCVDAQALYRKKSKKLMRLENESLRLENLVKTGSTLPSLEELERKIDKATGELKKKDEKIVELQMKNEEQDRRISQEQQKEKRRTTKLQQEIGETGKECQELIKRIKAVERKISKTNIYSRKLGSLTAQTQAQALAAITWYPPTEEQTPNNKVQKWLNKHS